MKKSQECIMWYMYINDLQATNIYNTVSHIYP